MHIVGEKSLQRRRASCVRVLAEYVRPAEIRARSTKKAMQAASAAATRKDTVEFSRHVSQQRFRNLRRDATKLLAAMAMW